MHASIRLTALANSLPPYAYTTEELLSRLPTRLSPKTVEALYRLGVKRRHFASPLEELLKGQGRKHSVAGLCCEAVRALGEDALKGLDYLIAASDDNDYLCPGLSHQLMAELGLRPDLKQVNLQGMGCTALAKALELAQDHLTRSPKGRVLVVLSGVNSHWFVSRLGQLKEVVKSPREVMGNEAAIKRWVAVVEAVLFGDGASALIVEGGPGGDGGNGGEEEGGILQVEALVHLTNLSRSHLYTGYATMAPKGDGSYSLESSLDPNIVELSVLYAKAVVERALSPLREERDRVMAWALHTGSRKILDNICSELDLPKDKVLESYLVLEECGNLAGASLTFILEKILKRRGPCRMVALGFGWGFSASALLLSGPRCFHPTPAR